MARGPGARRLGPSGGRLGAYRRRRDLGRSPEPDGAGRPPGETAWSGLPAGRRFCVQMHRASRLHFDLRLELGGALLSWAVPKGPSMAPGGRRLAIQVEDHPLDYGDFEELIPDGYGAGPVLLWDQGAFSWTGKARADPRAALRAGHLEFEARGHRLKGAFSLIRRDSGEQWLLVKHRDGNAGPAAPGLGDRSVKSGRTIEEIAGGDAPAPTSVAPSRRRRRDSAAGGPGRGQLPPVSPMLATLVSEPFDDPGWVFEVKYDGVRALVLKDGDRVVVRGRSGRDESARYPEIADAAVGLRATRAVVDGEIVHLDREGNPSFAALQRRMQLSGGAARRAAAEVPAVLMAFDVLELDGEDLRPEPLLERKRRLREVVPDAGPVRFADHVTERGRRFFQAARDRGLEGIMAKDGRSPYREGERSRSWLKVKARPTQDCVICGFTKGRGRSSELGALVLGVYRDGELVPAGRVGTGFSAAGRRQLRSRLQRLGRRTSPLGRPLPRDRGAGWVQPKLVAEVGHGGWTRAGRLRQPSFRTLREDVSPESCVPETPTPVASGGGAGGGPPTGRAADPLAMALEELAELPSSGGTISVGDLEVKVTHPDKVLWPAPKLTKRDLVGYHLRMAPFLLPHLRDRAVVMHVFPDGVAGPGFWRRARPRGAPSWVPSWKAVGTAPTVCPLLPSPAALVWAANSAAIELHPWHSRRDRPEQPDWAVFDIDPGAHSDFADAREVALVVRSGLERLGLRGLLKTTGQRGLHIYVPLRRRPSQDRVRAWVGEFADAVAQAMPGTVSEEWSVRRRGGQVRLDWTQNVVGKTLAGVYSPRPSEEATVSTPIGWEELDRVDPRDLNLRTVPARVARIGDLFAEVLEGGQRLPRTVRSEP